MTERTLNQHELSCDEIESLMPLYVLGLLDSDEASAIEAHVPLCPSCAAIARQFEGVTEAIPAMLTPIAPDPAIRAQLLDNLPDRAQPPVKLTERRTSRRETFTRIAAAVLLLMTLTGGVWIYQLIDERNEAASEAAMLEEFVSPNAVTMSLQSMPKSIYEEGAGASQLFKNPDGGMMLVVEGCPPSTDDRQYPVWVAMGDDRMLLGEMEVDDDGNGWMKVTFPDEMPEPEILGVSVIETGAEPVDLFIGTMSVPG